LLASLALASILPFLPALNAPFLDWDDAINLANNPYWRGFSPVNVRWMLTTMFGGPYQPLSWLSYALDFTLWGANPAAMRATNLALHAGSSVLFFLIMDELIKKAAPSTAQRERTVAALFAALFWAVHPLRVESVVWLTERRDVLSGFFYVLAVFLYIRTPEKPIRPLAAFCLAVLSKASALTLPLTLLLLDRWPLGRRSYADKIPYFIIAVATGIAGLAGQRAVGTLKGTGAALGLHALWWHSAKTVWPSGLAPHHRVPDGFGLTSPAVWGGALTLAALIWITRRRPAAATAASHYILALLPMAGFVRFGHHLVAERYSYLPALGLSALAGAVLWAARRRAAWRVPASALAVAALLGYGAMAARGASYWSSTGSLWRRTLEVDPGSTYGQKGLALEYYNSAAALGEQGRHGEQLAALERAARLDFDDPVILNNLGVALGRAGRHARAEAALRRATELNPAWPDAFQNLGDALKAQGRPREAAAAYAEAARLKEPKIR